MAKPKRYIVDTKREPDEPQSQTVEYVTGLKASCALAKKNAYSQQTRAVVKDLRNGREVGAYRFANNKNDVVGRGKCR
jgi:N-formylglutamate amidohydrolase